MHIDKELIWNQLLQHKRRQNLKKYSMNSKQNRAIKI